MIMVIAFTHPHIMLQAVEILVDLQVQTAFLQLAEANVLRPYMRDAVAEVSKACASLQSNDAAPSSAGKHFSVHVTGTNNLTP